MSSVLPDLGSPPTKNISFILRFSLYYAGRKAIFLKTPFILTTKAVSPFVVDRGTDADPRTSWLRAVGTAPVPRAIQPDKDAPEFVPMKIESLADKALTPAPVPMKTELLALIAPLPAFLPKKLELAALVALKPALYPKKLE